MYTWSGSHPFLGYNRPMAANHHVPGTYYY